MLKGETIRRPDSDFVGDSSSLDCFISTAVDGDNSSVLVLTFSLVDVELSTLILFSLSSIIIFIIDFIKFCSNKSLELYLLYIFLLGRRRAALQ